MTRNSLHVGTMFAAILQVPMTVSSDDSHGLVPSLSILSPLLFRLVVRQHSGGAGLGAGHIPGLPECNQRRFGSGHFPDWRRLAHTHPNKTSLETQNRKT